MTEAEMGKVVEAIMKARYEADSFLMEEPARSRPRPPASEREIDAFEEWLRSRGLSLPPSFRRFLHLHDGIEDFLPAFGLSMRSIRQIQESEARDAGWKGTFPGYRFIIASGDDSSARIGFLPETVDERGEMQVVMRNEVGDENEYDDLEAFLLDQQEYFEEIAEAEREDQEALDDD